ncbi:hypothetical protein CYFUS_000209 [Cystobacter fuscus]|uniref:Type I restriction modification DNA specificity domain-containing protein n=1 Tax=Cystobacter fuscus TaxID=43 RepID=A0A250IU83_9BACT|nr:restriction endonuclease subunit S [Cystobacter fuscus]ATB34802.1 hypothetical protein CYFUS_000209 [Cystobacter fuscus]
MNSSRWPVHPLGSLVETLFVGLPVSRYQPKEREPFIEEPVLSVGDIEAGRLVSRQELKSVPLRPERLDRFRTKVDDLLVACRGTLLKAARVPKETASLLASSNLIVVRSSDQIHPAILLALLRGPEWQERLHLRSRSSTGLMQLTAKDLEDLPVPVPPMPVQMELVALMEAEAEHFQSAIQAAELRRSLTQRLVLDVLSPSSGHEVTYAGEHD